MYDKNFKRGKFSPVKGLMFVGMIALFLAAMSAAVMFLWNWILPEVTSVKPINFWQAAGLLVLFKILTAGFGRGGWRKRMHRRKKWREKWMNMSEEERQEFKGKWKEYCRKRKD